MRRLVTLILLVSWFIAGPTRGETQASDDQNYRPSGIDFSMFFESDQRDSPECALTVRDGAVSFCETVTNPAITCPDSFAWRVFSEITAQEWWENWATDRQTFPSDPWPRCAPGESENCCAEVAQSNEIWPEHCPTFPHHAPGQPLHIPAKPSKAHQIALSVASLDPEGKDAWARVPAVLKNSVIGAVQDELVYRNETMLDYIFQRNLYSVEGLAQVYDNFTRAVGSYAPRRPEPDHPTRPSPKVPALTTVDFPIASIMVKVNWLAADVAPKYGIDPYDTDQPFIIREMVPAPETNEPPSDGEVKKKPYILLSMHISTKDLPNWFWATFEHVANQGRCDWLGCNDSFGYENIQEAPLDEALSAGLAAPARNYTPPHQRQKVDDTKDAALALAGRYLGVDRITDGLESLLAAYGVGTGTGLNRTGRPDKTDQAWRSYRLKGTQTNFVTPTGRATRLGNSVTEAGFVNSASCISCHSRAGVDERGLPPLAIFVDDLSDAGIPKSFNGSPVEAWFNVNAFWGLRGLPEAPQIRAIPTDFVWGFRLACPMAKQPLGPAWCSNVVPDDGN